MPTYDFECIKCQHKFEQKLSFKDEGSVECPRCRGEAKRLFTPVPVIFKGSGFYVTDHRQGGEVKAEAATPAEISKTESSPPKPAPTTE